MDTTALAVDSTSRAMPKTDFACWSHHSPPVGMHVQCRADMIAARQYVCPVCSVSILDMSATWAAMREVIALTPMPEEYRMTVKILCNDCNRESETDFHIDGLECRNAACGSFNTRRV